MSNLKVTQITPRHLRGTTFIGESGSTTHFHPHSRVILHEYATKEWILEHLGDLEDADFSELVTKKYAHETFGEIYLGPLQPIGVKVTDLWFDTGDEHLKMCDRVDLDDNDNVVGYNWINVAPRPSVDGDVEKLKEDVVVLQGEIDSLITMDEKGSWVSTQTNPPASGKVHFSSNDFTVAEMTATISVNDKDGTNHKFSTVDIGTWIEFVEDDADYCLGQIKDIGDVGDDHFQATFDVSVSKGTVHQDSVVKIRAFEAVDDFDPNSIRIVGISTIPPSDPNDGDLWYDNTEDTMQLYVYHHESDAWVAAAPPSTLDNRVTAGELLQAEIQAAQVEMQKTIDRALKEQTSIKVAPPGVKFEYQSGSSGLTSGHFQFWGSGSGTRMRLSSSGKEVDWLSEGINVDYEMGNGPYFTIYYFDPISNAGDRGKWKVRKHGRINRIDWHNDDILVYISSHHVNGSLSQNASYYVTIGGIL